MTDTLTHDLALARAERDAWQTTCEELHHQIARLTVEIESHLERIDAADQRARTIDAALAHEREAGRGLVAQVDTWRDTWARVETIVDEAFGPFPVWPVYDTICAMERGIHDGIRAAQELAAIRDLVAPGNPQGTVVDAVRTTMHALGLMRDNNERADAEIAKLRAEVAELRARPVLTVEALTAAISTSHDVTIDESERRAKSILVALGPVTLPSPDRAEELFRAYLDEPGDDFAAALRAALAKLSPAPAPSLDAAFLRRTLSATKHGPGGKGGNGPCDAACVKCEAERMLADAPAREAAPTDRVLVHADGGDCHGSRVVNGRCVKCGLAPDSQSTELWEPAKVDRIAADHAAAVKVEPTLVAVSDEELRDAYLNDPDDTLSGIRAVRAKLGAAEVTEERLAGAIREAYGHAAPEFVRAAWNHLRATAAKGG